MRVAIGQFGAPTTVLNSSLYGLLRQLEGKVSKVFGVVGGVHGLVTDHLIDLDLTKSETLGWLVNVPGAALRAGRFIETIDVVDQALQTLKRHDIDALVLMGGNGTMGLGAAIQSTARSKGYNLSVVGIPKTIDNDILGTDYSPGFPSAAHFVIKAVRDLQIDLEAMVGFEQVRVVEVMGRRCGWLAASTAMIPHLSEPNNGSSTFGKSTAPPIICLPEQPFSIVRLMEQIEHRVKQYGNALIVVSEGVRDAFGHHVFIQPKKQKSDEDSAQSIFGGIGGLISAQVRKQLGYGSRYENLGLLQRCWNDCSLATDRLQAERLGRRGAEILIDGQTGVMVGLFRQEIDKYTFEDITLPIQEIAGKDRVMTEPEVNLGSPFLRWLTPLIEIETLTQHRRLDVTKHIKK